MISNSDEADQMISNSDEASEVLLQVYVYVDHVLNMVSTVPTGSNDEAVEAVYGAAYVLRERLSDARRAVEDLEDTLNDALE